MGSYSRCPLVRSTLPGSHRWQQACLPLSATPATALSCQPVHFVSLPSRLQEIYKAAAGDFSDLQSVEESEWIELPQDIKPSEELFACKVEGESMNKIIPNGSVCLFRKYSGGSRNGQIVLVQHYDIQESEFGSGYTVKEYHSKKITTDEGWEHDTITLRPLSTDQGFENIILKQNQLNALKVIGTFVRVLT